MTHPRTCLAIGLAVLGIVPTIHSQPRQPPDPMKAITTSFNSVHKNLLEMAEDFPADKYGFKPKPEMRSFGEVLVHVFSGTTYAARAGRGEAVQWSELDAKGYADKAAVVAGLKKAMAEAYGLLVAYYRLNNLVPPASRPKK